MFDRLISILKSEGEDRSIADICKSIGISIDDLTDMQIKEINTNFLRCAGWKNINDLNNPTKVCKECYKYGAWH